MKMAKSCRFAQDWLRRYSPGRLKAHDTRLQQGLQLHVVSFCLTGFHAPAMREYGWQKNDAGNVKKKNTL
jgi:hypothetical protein